MTKISFNIKYKPQIESGEYKVQTNDGADVRIICWDAEGSQRKDDIIALVKGTLGAENIQRYYVTGKLIADSGCKRNKDLVIVTPEPELTEFEKAVGEAIYTGCDIEGMLESNPVKQNVREVSAKLFSLAREQFIKDGYVIVKKAFLNAVEKVDPEVMKEVSEDVDRREALRLECEKGRAEALKEFEKKYKWAWFNEGKIAGKFEGLTEDEKYQLGVHDGKEVTLKNLPRWNKCAPCNEDKATIPAWIVRFDAERTNESAIVHNGYYICFGELEKLPGFKED